MRGRNPCIKTEQIFTSVVLVLLALVFLTGCGQGLSDATKTQAKTVKQNLNVTQDFIEAQKKKYDRLSASPDFSAMAEYASREKWNTAFANAGATLTRAQKVYDKGLKVTIKQDKPEGEARAQAQIKQVNSVIREAKNQAMAPFKRVSRIKAAMTGTLAMEKSALASAETILSKVQRLEQGPVAKAKETFPDSEAKITARFAPFSKMADETKANTDIVESQYKAHTAGRADYAAFVTAADAIEQAKKTLSKDGPKFEKDLDQLYQSYTKILEDMKVDYYVNIHRESWDERSDFYNPGIFVYTIPVSPAVFQALTQSEAESIADLTPGFSGMNMRVTPGLESAFKSLNLDLVKGWPDSRHNAATFYLESSQLNYFHKYLKEENGETSETGWEAVKASFYEQNLENLGMAILSKPYGEFEPDSQAAPPGMAYVGNSKYGEWKKDESGNSFWSWYGRYAFFSSLFFFPPHYYSYGSWNRWNTDYRYKKPYYGQTKTGNTFGSQGTRMKQSPRYQNSTFSKTGGLKTASASVRGGASGLRGGGPKSKGK
ncbi:hypothetical protein DO021_17840 [Desulfobacter hydrogenophilus]|uniref:Uncharacterized protein n=1 Tax=Desulfobacter hydrogenophilus TaxID=2291 RepID=A0A328FC17_9BACT|nr:hypothetical protein [Desulfobacter hydrogenophilus]NDY73608.1 hypothetical protein [Desulfobacter hydrogenophilus]QBH12101.1 hypothetical protein EYB58_03675 [Desulfobacter hydrogenophilus]RAM00655.1 hypothetical protein DO021_17840 [Desulfobacter hydrogenophilus]